jgi:hypothetical protein
MMKNGYMMINDDKCVSLRGVRAVVKMPPRAYWNDIKIVYDSGEDVVFHVEEGKQDEVFNQIIKVLQGEEKEC